MSSSSSSASTKLAVVGAGKWGINHIKNLFRMGALGAVVEADESRHATLAKDFSGTQICTSIDELDRGQIAGVVVATPVNTHYRVGKTLLERKFPLLIEKPTTTRLSETEELLKIASQQELPLMTGFLLLYQPAIMKMKELIVAGAIGDIAAFHFNRVNFGRARSFENAFWSLGVHDIAVFAFLCPEEVCFVSKSLQDQRMETGNVEDEVKVTLHTKENTYAHFHSSWNWPFMRRELLVTGTKGFIYFDEIKNELSLHKKGFSPTLENVDEGVEQFKFEKVEALEAELRDFIAAIEQRSAPRAGPEITLRSAKILERIFNG